MDYRLSGLSTRTFEHLVQALSLKEVGNHVTPFGDGPDGGREATFSGRTNYGADGDKWDGYGIIQAKFKQRDGVKDGTWAELELAKELAAFEERKNPRRIPEYYIFATNVVLTAVQDSGSRDKIETILSAFAQKHSLKGYAVWDYDKIRILLDNNLDVRRSNFAWIAAGDVLYDLAEQLSGRRPDFHKVLVKLLQSDLAADRNAKLEQAGNSADDKIPLSQVFVDLPVSHVQVNGVDESFLYYLERGENFASLMVAAGDEPLSSVRRLNLDKNEGKRDAGRYVLVGGPGQGKTTLGQFVCQIYRTALLSEVEGIAIEESARLALMDIREQWRSGRLPMPVAKRLPFRIVLSEFAERLASGTCDGLLDYLSKYISKRVAATLESSDVRELMLLHPSLLVLDGLDEVPSSTNRAEVLNCVRDFRIDATAEGIDILIIATSRPQGYNDDFSPDLYRHLYLVPLPPKIALEYAERLTQIRFGSDPARYEKVISRLKRASVESATARLMQSPLQVTIMTLLVDRMGQPPQERWALFSEYYNLIYQREIERQIPAATVLRDFRSDIDAIHNQVGLVLQIECERSGSTDAKLTTEQFSSIVLNYLKKEGHEEPILGSLAQRIIDAAAHRLVFLVGLESDRVGFEIRSLQEFMAAEGILEGKDDVIESRLRHIAPISSWRNVLLFAAGRCFTATGRKYLREKVTSICAELNDDVADELSMNTLAGSRLALELLEDGPAARQPIFSRMLTRLAFRAIGMEDLDHWKRLLSTYSDTTASVFLDEISERYGDGQGSSCRVAALSAAKLIDFGANFELPWVRDLDSIVEAAEIEQLRSILFLSEGRPGLLRQALISSLLRLSPLALSHIGPPRSIASIWQSPPDPPIWLEQLHGIGNRRLQALRFEIPVESEGRTLVRIEVISVSQNLPFLQEILDISGSGPEWNFLKAMVVFVNSPSVESMIDVLTTASLADVGDVGAIARSFAPWPLLAPLIAGTSEMALWDDLAVDVRAGRWGLGLADWVEKEAVLASGISVEELAQRTDLLYGSDLKIGEDANDPVAYLDLIDSLPRWHGDEFLALPIHGLMFGERSRAAHGADERVGRPAWMNRAVRWMVERHPPLGHLVIEDVDLVDLGDPFWREWIESFGSSDMNMVFYHERSSSAIFQIALSIWKAGRSSKVLPALAVCAQSPKVPTIEFLRLDLDGLGVLSPLERFAAVILRVRAWGLAGLYDEVRSLVSEYDEFTPGPIIGALRCATSVDFEVEVVALYRLLRAVGSPHLDSIVMEMRRVLSARRSDLLTEGVWRDLALPSYLRLVVVENG